MVSKHPVVGLFRRCLLPVDYAQTLINNNDETTHLAVRTKGIIFTAFSCGRSCRRAGVAQIEVVFTSNGESADMYVERLTEELKDAGCPNVMVSL